MRTEAGKRLLVELAESPLPGARYAHDVVSRRLAAIEDEAVASREAEVGDDLTAAYMVGYERGKDFANLHARAVHGCDHVTSDPIETEAARQAMSPFEKAAAIERDRQWGEIAPGDPPWSEQRKSDALFMAGYDRRALLNELGWRTREDPR